MPVVAPAAFARDIGRTLSLLTKAARARRIYQPGNQALARMMRDLNASFEQLLANVDTIDLKVRPGGLFYEDQCVLEAPNPGDSLAFAFYRDGVRRLAFHRGLTSAELEVLVDASASGFTYSGLGEDTVTYLWRHELEHIQYIVVDTTIVDASELPEPRGDGNQTPSSVNHLDDAIDGLLRNIYGNAQEDVGITSLSLDRSDIAAKQIAVNLDGVDEMAPGFHPVRRFTVSPAYARELLGELDREDDHRVSLRAAHAVLHSVVAQVSGTAEARRLYEVLLKMYDAAIIDENLRLASYVLLGVIRCPETPERGAWLREALAETRLRQVAQNAAAAADRDLQSLIAFFRACGKAATSTVLTMLPSFPDHRERRILSELALELGIQDLSRIEELLHGDQAVLAQEALFLLSRLSTPEAKVVLLKAEYHPLPQLRIALLENAKLFGERDGVELGARLLEDEDPKVRLAAARSLARMPSRAVVSLFEARVQRPDFENEVSEVKLALLAGYAIVSQSRAVPIFARLVKKGEGLFAGRKAEETAVQAIRASRGVRLSPRMLDILKKAAVARNRRVRDTAREVLEERKARPS